MAQREDYRTKASREASHRVLAMCDQGAIVLGIGGGPSRIHPRILNVNIAELPNVNVVGDAHRLPIASQAVDAIHCEAVFEHLEDPVDAAAELYRVMKPGAIGFICTPFMQAFHGYPLHFQNFTHLGHRRMFERAGFVVTECGVGVGPAFALSNIVATFLATYPPRILRWPARAVWFVFSLTLIRPMDRWLASRADAFVSASSTYVVIEKPKG